MSDYEITFECSYEPDAISGIGDINNDGHDDFAMVEDFCDESELGVACIYLGYHWLNPDPFICYYGDGPEGLVGMYTAAAVGDVNGDQVDDFAIGALHELNWPGKAVIFAGNPDIVVGADDHPTAIPQELYLSVYPNPFNSSTTFEFDIPNGSRRIEITIYNTLGQIVHSQNLPVMGSHMKYHWQAEGAGSGVYFVQVRVGEGSAVEKVVLMK